MSMSHLTRRRFLVAGSSVLTGAALSPWEGAATPAAEPQTSLRFTEELILDKYGYAYGIAAADIDGDGHLDLTTADAVPNDQGTGDSLSWLANDGKGNFKRYFIQKNEPKLFERHAVGDINGDGHLDIVVVKNLGNQLLWFENNGTPRDGKPWKRHVITSDLPRAYDVCLVDLDGDGALDVAASSYVGGQIAWFANRVKTDGDKEWKKYLIEDKLGDTRTIRAADFNGDGRMDLLATSRTSNLVLWYENPGKPTNDPWKRHVIDDQCVQPTHGHAVDLDGDGDMDVVMALGMLAPAGTKNSHQVVWYENVGKPGKGLEWKKHVIGELENAFEVVAADLDGDGKLDVVATSWTAKGKLVWFQNPGDPRGEWKRHVLKENWSNANQVLVADLNKDGRPDIIACAERGANELRWWRNDGRPKSP